MHGRDTILHIQQRIIIKKAHVKFQPNCYQFLRKGKKGEHAHRLCIIHA